MPSPLSSKTPPTGKPRIETALVIGGGLVGQSIALRLQEAGVRTTLVEAEALLRGASWGNAGHIAVEQVAPLASRGTIASLPRRLFSRGGAVALPVGEIATWAPFALKLIAASRPERFEAGKRALGAMLAEALPAWGRLLDRAGALSLLRRDGHIVLWERAATAAAGRAAWAAADTGTASFRDLTAGELAALGALVRTPLAGGVRFNGSGQIADLGALTRALGAAFVGSGGTVRRGRAVRIGRGESGPCITLADGPEISADAVIVAAGVRSGELLHPIGHHVPIIAERGYHLQSSAPDWPEDMPPLVFEDRSMIVTRFDSGLRAASFVEFARADSPPDRRKWARLRAHVDALGLPVAAHADRWMGCRPTLPDYLPAIGASARLPGLYYAFGHQHLGLTLAAATAEAMAALLLGGDPAFPLEPFRLERFG